MINSANAQKSAKYIKKYMLLLRFVNRVTSCSRLFFHPSLHPDCSLRKYGGLV